MKRARDLSMTNAFHGPGFVGFAQSSDFLSMKNLTNTRRVRRRIDRAAELRVERDGSLQQERRDGLVLEAAGDTNASLTVARSLLVIEMRANRIEIAERRERT